MQKNNRILNNFFFKHRHVKIVNNHLLHKGKTIANLQNQCNRIKISIRKFTLMLFSQRKSFLFSYHYDHVKQYYYYLVVIHEYYHINNLNEITRIAEVCQTDGHPRSNLLAQNLYATQSRIKVDN